MKVLILMPVAEQKVYLAQEISRALELAGIPTLSIVGYCDFVKQTNISKNFEEAYFRAITCKLDHFMEEYDNLVVIGNCQKDYKFDDIYAFVEEIDEIYTDVVRDKIVSKWKTEPALKKVLDNCYKIEDARDTLHTVDGIVAFMKEYLK